MKESHSTRSIFIVIHITTPSSFPPTQPRLALPFLIKPHQNLPSQNQVAVCTIYQRARTAPGLAQGLKRRRIARVISRHGQEAMAHRLHVQSSIVYDHFISSRPQSPNHAQYNPEVSRAAASPAYGIPRPTLIPGNPIWHESQSGSCEHLGHELLSR